VCVCVCVLFLLFVLITITIIKSRKKNPEEKGVEKGGLKEGFELGNRDIVRQLGP
jgi:hypothetical protein